MTIDTTKGIAGLKGALRYVRAYRDQVFVVKLGGDVLGQPEVLDSVTGQLALLSSLGIRIVVVHGGGPQATALSRRLGAEPRMVAGRRVTEEADNLSDIAFYASMPYPIILFADRAIRKDAGRVSGLYLEAMSITGLLYTGSNMVFNRYRPETYDETVPWGERTGGNEKNSFFAGHVALVATSTFFTASIYDIYHPDSKTIKWALYGVAIAATGTTIYLRHVAGKHFPSDILVGTIVGVGSGMLVPRLHRSKPEKKTSWHFTPQVGQGLGFAATYRF